MNLKLFFTFCAVALFLVSCKTSSIVTSKREAEKLGVYRTPEKRVAKKDNKIKISKKSENNNALSEEITDTALQFLGVNYKLGGTTTDGMDCSGLMIASFIDYNIKLPRTSNEMSRAGILIEKTEAKKGDLIFFKTNGRSVINHVGMVIEISDEEIKFIHSSTQKGVIISSTKEGYYKNTFAQINRVIY